MTNAKPHDDNENPELPGEPNRSTVHVQDELNISSLCLSKAKMFLKHQRGGWGNLTPTDLYKGALAAYETAVQPYVPMSPHRVLDIGCGMALYDVFLLKKFGSETNMELYLLDKTSEQVRQPGFVGVGFHKEGVFSHYTNLECARQILIDNGASPQNVHAITASTTALDSLESSSFDFVFSLLSWGHHYPVKTYIVGVKRIMKRGSVLLLDLRFKPQVSQHMASGMADTMERIVQTCEGGSDLHAHGFTCQTGSVRYRGLTVLCHDESNPPH
eukprot:CAMPEP_0114311136 /NCGR_PEP_ID=MMETSP0059-20121206/19651_1 /TAXON_ID=36894 /ORGANISM="Pyramimonas parkeae, Strain CCMP726" /LENGTH=271 /DNA_ID=CAMNT_0001435265 /DNA_START=1208 /DNA_END=2023 /DNA_ORIENTATION=-